MKRINHLKEENDQCSDGLMWPDPRPVNRRRHHFYQFSYIYSRGTPVHRHLHHITNYQSPEDVDGEESDSKSDEAHCLQATVEVQVVLSPSQAQPARYGR